MSLPSTSSEGRGGETSGEKVSRSSLPDLDCAWSTQYFFSSSMMSASSTGNKKQRTKTRESNETFRTEINDNWNRIKIRIKMHAIYM